MQSGLNWKAPGQVREILRMGAEKARIKARAVLDRAKLLAASSTNPHSRLLSPLHFNAPHFLALKILSTSVIKRGRSAFEQSLTIKVGLITVNGTACPNIAERS